jgi:dynamin GTPase
MGALPMVVPDFKNIVVPAITSAMEEWRSEAEKSEISISKYC